MTGVGLCFAGRDLVARAPLVHGVARVAQSLSSVTGGYPSVNRVGYENNQTRNGFPSWIYKNIKRYLIAWQLFRVQDDAGKGGITFTVM